MHDVIRLLVALLALITAAAAAVRARRLQHAGTRADAAWPYAEPVCILLAGAVALAITYLI